MTDERMNEMKQACVRVHALLEQIKNSLPHMAPFERQLLIETLSGAQKLLLEAMARVIEEKKAQ